MKLSDIAFTCDYNFVIVLKEFASVSILKLNGLGAFPAELKHWSKWVRSLKQCSSGLMSPKKHTSFNSPFKHYGLPVLLENFSVSPASSLHLWSLLFDIRLDHFNPFHIKHPISIQSLVSHAELIWGFATVVLMFVVSSVSSPFQLFWYDQLLINSDPWS